MAVRSRRRDNRRCEHTGCDTQPYFGKPGETRGRRCAKHKTSDMVNVRCRQCEHTGCYTRPSYSKPGETRGRWCSKHKSPDMVDVEHPRCEQTGCKKLTPQFANPGETRGRWCAVHKKLGMIDVRNRRCEYTGCMKRPVFAEPGDTRGWWCSRHKTPSMVDVTLTLRCEHAGCDKRPVFADRGETRGVCCAEHKRSGMIDVISRRCEYSGCDKNPSFADTGDTRGRWCLEHKTQGMVDVKHRRCELNGCDTRARFGLPGHNASRCAPHRQVNMVANPRKRCLEPGCLEIAVFGITVHEHCEAHKNPEEINVSERICTTCGLLGLLDMNEHCQTCDPATFVRIRLAKQNAVRDYLVTRGIKLDLVDRMIEGGVCGRERPDFFIDCGTHLLVIEVDEDQHSGRACECEQTRMVNISQSCGMPTMFIRYNPDSYKAGKGKKQVATSKRLAHLLEWVKHLQTTQPSEFLQVLYLYFDHYKLSEEHFIVLLSTNR